MRPFVLILLSCAGLAACNTRQAEAPGVPAGILFEGARLIADASAQPVESSAIDGFAHGVRDRDIDDEFLALIKARQRLNDAGVIIGVVLDANPLDDIANTRRLSRVYLRGQEVDRAVLKAAWSAPAQGASE